MIYKSGQREMARSYRPISVATRMYSILARLISDTLRGHIDITAALSDPQAGSRQGYTTPQQAHRMSMLLHQYGDGVLACLLDIAKSYPSMPHECLTYRLRLIGTPARINNMMASIYAQHWGVRRHLFSVTPRHQGGPPPVTSVVRHIAAFPHVAYRNVKVPL